MVYSAAREKNVCAKVIKRGKCAVVKVTNTLPQASLSTRVGGTAAALRVDAHCSRDSYSTQRRFKCGFQAAQKLKCYVPLLAHTPLKYLDFFFL